MARWSQEKRAQVRAEILDAARDVFEAEGFEGATMRQIAARAGIATGTLFNYVEDKQALLFEALRQDLEEVLARCLTELPAAPEQLEALLVAAASPFFAHYCARPALSQALLERALWARGEPGQAFRAQIERLAEALLERLEGMRERGVLRPEADPRHITLAFFSHYYFVLLTELSEEADPERMRALVGALARQLSEGVGPLSPSRGGDS